MLNLSSFCRLGGGKQHFSTRFYNKNACFGKNMRHLKDFSDAEKVLFFR